MRQGEASKGQPSSHRPGLGYLLPGCKVVDEHMSADPWSDEGPQVCFLTQ